MALALGPLQIGLETGLLALLSLIPFILMYLIRPKPPELKVPSINFFMKMNYRSPVTSFLRRFIQDILILLQFLILLFLALSVAKPFILVNHEVTGQNTVLVLDVSASSLALEGGTSRFELMRSHALEQVGTRNTVILSKEIPLVALTDVSSGEATDYIKNLEPTASASRIGDAILLAGEVLTGGEGHVIVISDLIKTSGIEAELAKSIVESTGPVVDFITITDQKLSNVGFVDARVTELTTQLSVKNYDSESHKVALAVGDARTELTLPPTSIETFTFDTPPGQTRVTIEGIKDDFRLDNTFYLSAPTKTEIRVLYISNNKSLFLEQALLASPGIELTHAAPPIVPKSLFDVYIIDDVDNTQVLPGTFEDIEAKVRLNGAAAIVIAQEETPNIDYKGLIPIDATGLGEAASTRIDSINALTRNIDFGRVNQHVTGTLRDGAEQLVTVGESPMVATMAMGSGTVLYFGFFDSGSDFRFSPFYPIFWNEAVNFLVGKTDITLLNYRADETLNFADQVQVTLPNNAVQSTAVLPLEQVGFYEVPGRTVAVNLLNERESNINKKAIDVEDLSYELRTVVEERPLQLEWYLLIIVAILLVFEVLYIKWRGDI